MITAFVGIFEEKLSRLKKQLKQELETKRISQALNILKDQHNYNIYVKTLLSVEKTKNKVKKIKQEKRFKKKHNKIRDLCGVEGHKSMKLKFLRAKYMNLLK